MPRNIFQDIVPKEDRSIRRVPLMKKESAERGQAHDVFYERGDIYMDEPHSSSWRRVFLWGITFIFIILLGIALATSFTGATVKVSSKTKLASVSQEMTAEVKEGAAISMKVLPVSETAETSLLADTMKRVSEKAAGTIIIYNNFSEKPQRLIKNTRFETPKGLMYRIGSSVTVPGQTIKDGKKIPGSIEAVVSADSPGEEYNTPLSDFTIPGFKSDLARFSGFYARSKTAMTGGFEGTIKLPGEAALASARATLRETLVKKVAEKAGQSVPDGFVSFDGALVATYESLPPKPADGELSSIEERAGGAVYAFKREDLEREIAKAAVRELGGAPVAIPNLGSLSFEFKEPPGVDPARVERLRFTLKGNANIVWVYDAKKLSLALAGRDKTDLPQILADFGAIERADFIIKPFWSQSFPRNPRKISIDEVNIPTY